MAGSRATLQRTGMDSGASGGGLTRVQRITRSASGSPLATPWWKGFPGRGCQPGPAHAGSQDSEAAAAAEPARKLRLSSAIRPPRWQSRRRLA